MLLAYVHRVFFYFGAASTFFDISHCVISVRGLRGRGRRRLALLVDEDNAIAAGGSLHCGARSQRFVFGKVCVDLSDLASGEHT